MIKSMSSPWSDSVLASQNSIINCVGRVLASCDMDGYKKRIT